MPPNDMTTLSRNSADQHYVTERKARGRSHILRTVIIVVACVLAVGVAGAWAYVNGINANLHNGLDDVSSALQTSKPGKPFYMLLLGTDRDEARSSDDTYGSSDHAYRSDSIMLARIDPQKKKVTLVSIHRDTLVDLGENGQQKINAAYAIGGAKYAIQVVSDFAGVDISHYAEVDMDGMAKVVDEVGGIDVTLPIDVKDPNYTGLDLKAGKQHLDGTTAALLCRARHAYDSYGDGDLYRAANQRIVIEAVAKKVLSSDPKTMAATIKDMANCVKCDLDVDEIVTLATQFRDMDTSKDIMTGMEPTTSKYVDGTWYEICDEEAWKAMMERVDKGLSPYESSSDDTSLGVSASTGDAASSSTSDDSSSQDESASSDESTDSDKSGTISVLNASGVSGLAGTAASALTNKGFAATAGNARMHGLSSAIVYNNGKKDLAEEVASALGTSVAPQENNGSYSTSADVLVIIGSDWG